MAQESQTTHWSAVAKRYVAKSSYRIRSTSRAFGRKFCTSWTQGPIGGRLDPDVGSG